MFNLPYLFVSANSNLQKRFEFLLRFFVNYFCRAQGLSKKVHAMNTYLKGTHKILEIWFLLLFNINFFSQPYI